MHLKLVVVITRTDLTDRVISVAKDAGATGATVLPARGTGINEARTFFGLSLDIQRDLVLFLLSENLVDKVLQSIREKLEFTNPGTGIGFALDVESVIGMSSQIPHFNEEIREHYA